MGYNPPVRYAPYIVLPLLALGISATTPGCGDSTNDVVDPPGPGTAGTDVTTNGGINHPPELHKIGHKIVEIGKSLVIEPKATDADGDALKFFRYGKLPDGASWIESPPRFAWKPLTLSAPVSLTFVVSDGLDTDRETIKIEIVSETTNHPPVFQQIGEQYVESGDPYYLQLQASDTDGDPLSFSAPEGLPEGAALDGGSGLFSWTPAADSEGKTFAVEFAVSDGSATATLSVTIHVLAPGQNKPPAFLPVGQQIGIVGETYSLTVQAVDAEDDPLEYGLDGAPPAGAAFDKDAHTLTWIPLPEQAGSAVELLFWVSDGSYTIYIAVDVFVQSSVVDPNTCTDDFWEPNNTAETAKPVTVGNYEKLSICDTDQTPIDADWFSVSLVGGQTLSVTLSFSHGQGDLDMALYKSNNPGVAIAKADSATDNEVLSFGVDTAGTYLLRVFGTGQASFASPYTMEISTTGLSCTEDVKEPNDNFLQAVAIDGNSSIVDLQYCPGDLDVYQVEVGCGQTIIASIDYNQFEGDLDVHLYRESDEDDPVASGDSAGSPDIAKWQAPEDGKVFVLVTGKPPESTLNGYSLQTSTSGSAGCVDDGKEPNNNKIQSTLLLPPADELDGLTLCCNPDWFYMPLKVNDGLLVNVKFAGSPNVSAKMLDTDGKTVLAVGEVDATGLILQLDKAPFSASYYLVVEGEPGIAYEVEIVVVTSDGCVTSKACGDDLVCEKLTGKCVSDFCTKESDCPTGQDMPCWETYCLDGCTYDAECKLSYSCKGFEFGHYCGQNGNKPVGDPCLSHVVCSGSSSCHFKSKGGYCTNVGCKSNAECGSDSDCVQFGDITLCGKNCDSNDDCRVDDGYTCLPKTLPSGIPTQVCLPAS